MFNLIFNKVNIVIVKSVFQLGYGSRYYVVSSSGNRTVCLLFPHRIQVSTWNQVCTGNDSVSSTKLSMAGLLDDVFSESSTALTFSSISPSMPCFL